MEILSVKFFDKNNKRFEQNNYVQYYVQITSHFTEDGA